MKNATLAALQDRFRRIAEHDAATALIRTDELRTVRGATAIRSTASVGPEPAPPGYHWLPGTPFLIAEAPRVCSPAELACAAIRRLAAKRPR